MKGTIVHEALHAQTYLEEGIFNNYTDFTAEDVIEFCTKYRKKIRKIDVQVEDADFSHL